MIYMYITNKPCQQKHCKHREPLKVRPQLQKQNLSTWDHRGTGCRLLIATQNQPTRIAGKRLDTGAATSLLKCATSKLFWYATPASLKAGYPPWPCVLLWMNCFLFHFVSIFLYKLTLFYCSPGPHCGTGEYKKRGPLAVLLLVKEDRKSVTGDAGYHCRVYRRMASHFVKPFPLSLGSWPYNATLPRNGPLE